MQLLKDAVGIFNRNVKLYVGIVIIPVALSVLAALFEPAEGTAVTDLLELCLYVVLTAAAAIANIWLIMALIIAINNPSLSVGGVYGASKAYFWRYLGFSIVSTLVLLVAFLLLIIPGVIVSVWLTFSSFVLILENGGIIESMKKSREYVRGRWWGVFGRSVFISLVTIPIFMVTAVIAALLPGGEAVTDTVASALSTFWLPIAMAYLYLMYQDVKSRPIAPVV